MLARPEPGEGKNKCLIVRVSREHCERRIENSLTPEVENMRRSDAGKHNDNNAINALNDPNGLVSSIKHEFYANLWFASRIQCPEE
jgi:hypothetical protein